MPTEPKRPLKVFLSYASQDRPAVRELYERLKSEGWIKPWLDQENLTLGQHWTSVIEDALDEADAVVIFLSSNSVQKEGFIQRELNYAWEISLEKPRSVIFLIPLRLDTCTVPRYLRSRQWGDYFDDKKETTYRTLLRSLSARHKQKLSFEAAKKVAREEKEAAKKAAREKAEKEAANKKEADEKTAREKAEREATEKAAREKAEKEAAEKATREKAEKEAAREKAEREAAEKATRDKLEKENARFERREATKASLIKAVAFLKSVFFSRGALVFGTAAILIGIGYLLSILNDKNILQRVEVTQTIKVVATSTASPLPPTSTKTTAPTKTITPTPTLTLVPQSSILLLEDFEDGNADGWSKAIDTDYVGNWTIEQEANGNHYLSGTGTNDYPQIWYGDTPQDWSDYAFESRIQFVTKGQIFICIRSNGGTSFYAVYLNTSEIGFIQYNPSKGIGFSEVDVSAPKKFNLRKWYTVRLEITQNVLKTYVDNVLVRSSTLPSPLVDSQGSIGYYMGGGQIFYIDDIRVWSLK